MSRRSNFFAKNDPVLGEFPLRIKGGELRQKDRSFLALLLLLLILLLGFSLRGLYLLEIRKNPDFSYPAIDASYHDYWARGLVTGTWSVPPGREDPQIYRYPFYRPPGYAYFLALIYRIGGMNYLSPRLVQMVMGMGSSLLAFFLGRRWFGWVVGELFAFLMATYWIFIYFEGELVGVVLTVFLSLILFSLLTRRVEDISWKRSLAVGLVLGVMALFRPNILLFCPVAAGWMIWAGRRRRRKRGQLVSVSALFLGVILAVAPATARNCLVAGEWVPIATNLGVSLAVANNEFSDGTTHVIPGIGDIGTPYDYPRIVRHLERELAKPLRHSEASSYLVGRALSFIRTHPGDFFRLLGRKALLFWGPIEIRNLKEVHFARRFSPVLGATPGSFPLLLASSLVGTGILLLDTRKGRGEKGRLYPVLRGQFEVAVLVLLYIGTYFFSMLPFAAAARYRVPVIPFLLLLGAYGLKRVGEFGVKRDWLRFASGVGMGALCYLVVRINYSGYEPSLEKWHYDLALAYTDQEDWDNAIRQYQKAIDLKPDFARAFNNLGNIYVLRGEYDQAINYYSEVLRLNPDLPQVHSNLGNALFKLGRTQEAIGYFEEALRLRPDLVEAQNNLGVALLKLGRFEDAIAHYRKALEYKPANVATHVNLAHALTRLGDYGEARRHLETALRLQPDCEAARQALEKLRPPGSFGKIYQNFR